MEERFLKHSHQSYFVTDEETTGTRSNSSRAEQDEKVDCMFLTYWQAL